MPYDPNSGRPHQPPLPLLAALLDSATVAGEAVLVCPSCGGDYTHLARIEPSCDGTDHQRLAAELTLWCESCPYLTVIRCLNVQGRTHLVLELTDRAGPVLRDVCECERGGDFTW